MATYNANHPAIKMLRNYRTLKYLESSEHGLNQQQQAFVNRIESAINSLPQQERELIEKRYLIPEADYTYDQQIYKDVLMISQPIYKKRRQKAFDKLEIILATNKTQEDA